MDAKPVEALHLVVAGDTTYHVRVATISPAGTKGLPWTVFCLDGDNLFGTLMRAARRAPAQRWVVVGIGYGAGYGKPANRRGRDYSDVAIREEPTSGGGAIFRDFVCNQLWPWVQAHHEVDPTRRFLVGHSIGALWGLTSLFRNDPFFTDVLASSPSIWWADRAVLAQTQEIQDNATALPARLYLSVGDKDSESMLGDLELLVAQLRRQPVAGLDWTCEHFPDRDHYNASSIAFRQGLAWLAAHSA